MFLIWFLNFNRALSLISSSRGATFMLLKRLSTKSTNGTNENVMNGSNFQSQKPQKFNLMWIFFQLTLNRFYVYDRNTNFKDFFGGDSSFSLFHSLVALTMLKHS